jgi:arabinogalactan endo-1,4-beta-galactosidase
MKKTLTLFIMLLALTAQCRRSDNPGNQSKFAAVSSVGSGKPVRVVMTTYKTTMLADGKDETLIRAFVVDSAGREIRTAEVPIQISVTGDGRIAGTTNGIPVVLKKSENGTTIWESKLVKGSCPLIFQAGTKVDKIKVEVRSDSLWPGSHEIHTINPDVKLLKPSADQITPVAKNIGRSIGADISFLPQMEARGMKFMEDTIQKDAMAVLAEHGFNYIRLRIFVNPENEKGYSPVTGYCGLEYTKQMALSARKAGMKLLLNFHYSDYWADPQQQNKPLAWKDLDFKTLKDSLRSYTIRVLLALKEQGTLPEMVQVGNEINHGILWPDGHIGNLDNLAELLKAGVEGIKEVDPSIITMMHIALGGQNDEAVFWLDNMIARGVNFDVIGLSYYPRWHGTLDDLYFNTNDLVKRYNKDINVVEYSQFRKEIHEIVFGLPGNHGEGTFIWEPLNIFFGRDGTATKVLKEYDDLGKLYLTGK